MRARHDMCRGCGAGLGVGTEYCLEKTAHMIVEVRWDVRINMSGNQSRQAQLGMGG